MDPHDNACYFAEKQQFRMDVHDDNVDYFTEEEQLQTDLDNDMDDFTKEEHLQMDSYDDMDYFTDHEQQQMDHYDNSDYFPDNQQLRIFDHHGELNLPRSDLDICEQDWGMRIRYDSLWIRTALKSISEFDGTNMPVDKFINDVWCSMVDLEPEEVDIFHHFLWEKLRGDARHRIYPLRKYYDQSTEILNDLQSLYSTKNGPAQENKYNKGRYCSSKRHVRHRPYGRSNGSARRYNAENASRSDADIFYNIQKKLPQVEPDAETGEGSPAITVKDELPAMDTSDQLEKNNREIIRNSNDTVTKTPREETTVEMPLEDMVATIQIGNRFSAVSILRHDGTAQRPFNDSLLDGSWSIQKFGACSTRVAECQGEKSMTAPNETGKGVG